MLRMILTETGHYTPVVYCEWCRAPITDMADGNYEWLVDLTGEPVDGHLFYAHQECTRIYDTLDSGVRWRSESLKGLWTSLGASTWSMRGEIRTGTGRTCVPTFS